MNLEIKNGNFSYTDGNPILKDINLKIESGEIFTILGQNGILVKFLLIIRKLIL